MSVTPLDEQNYQRLLGKTLPIVVRTDAEYHRSLGGAAELVEQPEDEISEEEGRPLAVVYVDAEFHGCYTLGGAGGDRKEQAGNGGSEPRGRSVRCD